MTASLSLTEELAPVLIKMTPKFTAVLDLTFHGTEVVLPYTPCSYSCFNVLSPESLALNLEGFNSLQLRTWYCDPCILTLTSLTCLSVI